MVVIAVANKMQTGKEGEPGRLWNVNCRHIYKGGGENGKEKGIGIVREEREMFNIIIA